MRDALAIGAALLLALLSPAPPAWADPVGDERERYEWGLLFDYGRAISVQQPGSGMNLLALIPRFGYALSPHDGLGGRLEAVAETPLLVLFHRGTIYGGGFTALLSYSVGTGTRLTPFVEAGGGVLLTTPRAREVRSQLHGSQVNFTPQAGAGFRYRLAAHAALTIEYRYLHISNGGLAQPNGGLNANLVLVGVSLAQ